MGTGRGNSHTAQQVRFCRGRDDVRLAYASHGSGPPLLINSCWLSHLEYDWQSPVWRHYLADLGSFASVVRYDERGFGLSDWDIDDFSLDARLADLERVVDAAGLDRFALLGMSGGAPVAVSYAAAHPERVTRLVLHGSAVVGCFGETADDEAEEAFLAMIRAGWARPDSLFRRMFTNIFIPDATEEQMVWMDELQRVSTSTANAVAGRTARRAIDVTAELPRITAETLILHARGDRASPFRWGRELAARIPHSRLVLLESDNHILLEGEPAWEVFRDEVRDFIRRDEPTTHPTSALSPRERDILAEAASGYGNVEIAARLHLSARTVERHLQNAYLKLGVCGKTARAAAVAALLSDNAPSERLRVDRQGADRRADKLRVAADAEP